MSEIVADADAISHFDDTNLLLRAERILGEVKSEEEANEKIKAKLIRSWGKLSLQGKKFVESKYPKLQVMIK